MPTAASAPKPNAMFAVDEPTAEAIRRAFDVEFQRHFSLIRDHEKARQCVRIIAGWKPLPAGEARRVDRSPRRRKAH